MSTATAESRRIPNKRHVELKLRRRESGEIYLFAAKWTGLSGNSKSSEVGRGWNKKNSLPGARETWALLFVCYWLHEIANPGQWLEFRFPDRKSLSISGILSNKGKSGAWVKKLNSGNDIETVCNQSGQEILIDDLTPYQVGISLDGVPLQSLAELGRFDLLREVVHSLSGQESAEVYDNRYLKPLQTRASVRRHEATDNSEIELHQQRTDLDTQVVDSLGVSNQRIAVDNQIRSSLVGIWVNDRVAGTGIVVADGKVLTCAHVVCDWKGSSPKRYVKTNKSIALEFSGKSPETIHRSETQEGRHDGPSGRMNSAARQPNSSHRVSAVISQGGWSPVDQENIAILEFDGPLPAGVLPIRFSFQSLQGGEKCQTRGFTVNGVFDGAPVDDLQILSRRAARGNRQLLEIDSVKIHSAHGGAPLCDSETGLIYGIINTRKVQTSKSQPHERASVIPSAALVRLIPWLRTDSEPKSSREEVDDSYAKLEMAIEICLQNEPSIRNALSAAIKKPHLSSPQQVKKLITALVDPQTDLISVVSCLENLADECDRTGDSARRGVINGLFSIFGPFRMEKKYAVEILEGLGVSTEKLMSLPFDSLILFEFVMAAIDARKATFQLARPGDRDSCRSPSATPRPMGLLDQLPEEGFSLKTSKPGVTQSNELFLQTIVDHVRQSIGRLPSPFGRNIRFEATSLKGQINELNIDLQVLRKNRTTPFLHASTKQRRLSSQEIKSIRSALSFLAFVDLKPSDETDPLLAAVKPLTSPVRSGKLVSDIDPHIP